MNDQTIAIGRKTKC